MKKYIFLTLAGVLAIFSARRAYLYKLDENFFLNYGNTSEEIEELKITASDPLSCQANRGALTCISEFNLKIPSISFNYFRSQKAFLMTVIQDGDVGEMLAINLLHLDFKLIKVNIKYASWRMLNENADFSARDGAEIVEFKDKVWMFGGWTAHGVTSEIWSSQDDLKKWKLIKAKAGWKARHSFGLVKFKDQLWLVGGDYNSDVWRSEDAVNWHQVTSIAPWGRRYSPYVCVFKNKIWFMGGQENEPFSWNNKLPSQTVLGHNDVWSSSDGFTWDLVLKNAPWKPRALIHGCVADEQRMFILGGGLKEGLQGSGAETVTEYNDVWATTDGKNWTLLTEKAPWEARTHFNIINFKNHFYVIGGSVGTQVATSNTVWSSDNGIDWVENIKPLFGRRHAASVFIYKDKLHLGAGYFYNDVWRLDMPKIE